MELWSKISKKFLDILNKEIDNRVLTKNNDYSSKLASQIKKEIKIPNNFIKKNLEREIKKNIKNFLKNYNIVAFIDDDVSKVGNKIENVPILDFESVINISKFIIV